MLRLSAFVIVMTAATGTALAADQIIPPHVRRHVRVAAPGHHPRPHHNYGAMMIYPPRHAAMVEPDRDALISPSIPMTPLLPGSSTFPGYYGRPFDYDYQGPYYGGGPYPSYFFRLPYACGIYGYC
ncbi:MAG: hypothetical protein ACREDL_00640 [Bradyrhizobium sp.]